MLALQMFTLLQLITSFGKAIANVHIKQYDGETVSTSKILCHKIDKGMGNVRLPSILKIQELIDNIQ